MPVIKVETTLNCSEHVIRGSAGHFAILLDEPKSAGGTDQGASPLQYLLTSLGGCFIAMGRMVAGEMGLKLDSIRCAVEGEIDFAGLSEKDPNVRPGFKEIRLKLEVKSNEPADKIRLWEEKVEKRCPVKDCLVNPTPVKVSK